MRNLAVFATEVMMLALVGGCDVIDGDGPKWTNVHVYNESEDFGVRFTICYSDGENTSLDALRNGCRNSFTRTLSPGAREEFSDFCGVMKSITVESAELLPNGDGDVQTTSCYTVYHEGGAYECEGDLYFTFDDGGGSGNLECRFTSEP